MDSQIINPITHLGLANGNLRRAVEMLNEKEPFKRLPEPFQNLIKEAQFHIQVAISRELERDIGIGEVMAQNAMYTAIESALKGGS